MLETNQNREILQSGREIFRYIQFKGYKRCNYLIFSTVPCNKLRPLLALHIGHLAASFVTAISLIPLIKARIRGEIKGEEWKLKASNWSVKSSQKFTLKGGIERKYRQYLEPIFECYCNFEGNFCRKYYCVFTSSCNGDIRQGIFCYNKIWKLHTPSWKAILLDLIKGVAF